MSTMETTLKRLLLAAALILPAGVARTDGPGPDGLVVETTRASEAGAPPTNASELAGAPVDDPFSYTIGDKVKVSFYEELDLKQGSADAALRTLYNRVDLTAEYTVEADGAINLPRLGRIVLAGRGPDVVQADLLSRYEDQIGRSGDVHIAITERLPVYVVGPVRQPGSFRFTEGMVAIQAIALAGGMETGRERLDPMLRARQETERSDQAAARLASLLARQAYLEAAQDQRKPAPPRELVRLVGEANAAQLIAAEARAGEAAAAARAAETASFDSAIVAGEREVASVRASAQRIEREIAARLAMIEQVTEPDPRLTDRQTVARLRGEIAELELRLQQFEATIQQINQAIARDVAARERIRLDHGTAVAREIVANASDIVAMKQTIVGAERAAGSIYGTLGPSDTDGYVIEIVRSTLTGPVTFDGTETTALRPGDVIRMRQPGDRPRAEAGGSGKVLR
jgi:protein involved in polysaccharide export with SLBB domain